MAVSGALNLSGVQTDIFDNQDRRFLSWFQDMADVTRKFLSNTLVETVTDVKRGKNGNTISGKFLMELPAGTIAFSDGDAIGNGQYVNMTNWTYTIPTHAFKTVLERGLLADAVDAVDPTNPNRISRQSQMSIMDHMIVRETKFWTNSKFTLAVVAANSTGTTVTITPPQASSGEFVNPLYLRENMRLQFFDGVTGNVRDSGNERTVVAIQSNSSFTINSAITLTAGDTVRLSNCSASVGGAGEVSLGLPDIVGTGTLGGINPALQPKWRCREFAGGGSRPLTSQLLQNIALRMMGGYQASASLESLLIHPAQKLELERSQDPIRQAVVDRTHIGDTEMVVVLGGKRTELIESFWVPVDRILGGFQGPSGKPIKRNTLISPGFVSIGGSQDIVPADRFATINAVVSYEQLFTDARNILTMISNLEPPSGEIPGPFYAA